jgi:vacuolar-type H+-ATPase subunit D/Vma8
MTASSDLPPRVAELERRMSRLEELGDIHQLASRTASDATDLRAKAGAHQRSIQALHDTLTETRQELHAGFDEMRRGFGEVRSEMTAGFAAVRTEFVDVRSEMAAGFAAVRTEFVDVRSETAAGFAAVRTEFVDVRSEMTASFAEVRSEMAAGFQAITQRLDRMQGEG